MFSGPTHVDSAGSLNVEKGWAETSHDKIVSLEFYC